MRISSFQNKFSLMLTLLFAFFCSSASSGNATNNAGELYSYCKPSSPTHQQTYCLGYLIGAHETITIIQKVNGYGSFCMKVAKDGRSGKELKNAFNRFLESDPSFAATTSRVAVTAAFVAAWPCGQ